MTKINNPLYTLHDLHSGVRPTLTMLNGRHKDGKNNRRFQLKTAGLAELTECQSFSPRTSKATGVRGHIAGLRNHGVGFCLQLHKAAVASQGAKSQGFVSELKSAGMKCG